MKKIFISLIIASGITISYSNKVYAHTGHDHADRLHEKIALIAVLITAVLIVAGVKVLTKKIKIKKKS